MEALLLVYSLRVYFSEVFLPRWLWELCVGLPNESLNCIKFYRKAFTYMVFLDMGGIYCINYIGNYYTVMRCLNYFNQIILWTKPETLRIVVIHMKLVLVSIFLPAVMHSQTVLVHNPRVSWRTFKALGRLGNHEFPLVWLTECIQSWNASVTVIF